MKKTIMVIAASAAVALAPMSAALAETVSAKSDEAVATAWVPASQAEQVAARGGYSKGFNLSWTTRNALNTVGCFITSNIPAYNGYSYQFCRSQET